jgi:colanic acid biosynthesis glycosyl transferase WcaI
VFLNQFYWPDSAPTAVLLDQVTRYAVSQGHDVTVICGQSGYFEGAESVPPPVRICRVGSLPFSRNPLNRLLSWGSYFVLAAWRLIRIRRCDILVTMTTPPGLSIIGALLRRYLDAELWIWEMDVYPDVVIATGGMKADSFFSRVLQRLFTWSRRRATGIIALGECMKARLASSGIAANRIHIAENWASDYSELTPVPVHSAPLQLLYSGNLGMAHEVETVATVLRDLAKDDIQFVFAGGGAARGWLEQFCRDHTLGNIEFQSYGDIEQFRNNLSACHLGLVTLRNSCEGTVVPSKIYSLMAAGRPILFIGPHGATPAKVIRDHECGWHFEPGQTTEISAFLRSLSRHPERALEAGERAQRTFSQHYSRYYGTQRLLRVILAHHVDPL